MFVDEVHSINYLESYRRELKLYNKQLLNTRFIKPFKVTFHFALCQKKKPWINK